MAAYFSSCNRNKYSVAVDFKTKEGQDVVKHLLQSADIVIENFKAGGLAKLLGSMSAPPKKAATSIVLLRRYGLGYDQLKDDFPQLILATQEQCFLAVDAWIFFNSMPRLREV